MPRYRDRESVTGAKAWLGKDVGEIAKCGGHRHDELVEQPAYGCVRESERRGS